MNKSPQPAVVDPLYAGNVFPFAAEWFPEWETIRRINGAIFQAMDGAQWYRPDPQKPVLLMAGGVRRRALLLPSDTLVQEGYFVACSPEEIDTIEIANDWDTGVPSYMTDNAFAIPLLQRLIGMGYRTGSSPFPPAGYIGPWRYHAWVSFGCHDGVSLGESNVSLAHAICLALDQVIRWAAVVAPNLNGRLPIVTDPGPMASQKETTF